MYDCQIDECTDFSFAFFDTVGCSRPLCGRLFARCTETESGARTIDHLLTQTLLPELSEHVLDRLAERAEFDLIRIELDPSGRFAYAFSGLPLSGTVREAVA